MKEEHIYFPCGNITLEGLGFFGADPRGVVVSHPHPLMGGCMINNVVEAMVSAFHEQGFSTLRFNFRGVEGSEGAYDEGIGEQGDVLAAKTCLIEKGSKEIALAGYSFGAWVHLNVLSRENVFSPVILVSPAVNILPFDFSTLQGKVSLIICGDRDQFSSVEKLEEIAGKLDCALKIVKGADHFFVEREGEIIRYIREYLTA